MKIFLKVNRPSYLFDLHIPDLLMLENAKEPLRDLLENNL